MRSIRGCDSNDAQYCDRFKPRQGARELALSGLPDMSRAAPLMVVRGLKVQFELGAKTVAAVDGLDLDIGAGETVALVGESGCGKSTAALALLGLLPASARVSGSVQYCGTELLALPPSALRALRGHQISMIFQEPMSSLNPVHRIGAQIGESLIRHLGLSARAARARAIELLDLVQIAEPARRIDDFPHQLSGGQRQRVMIAMAVSCSPRLLIADEPTTALDVTVQAQILALLDHLRRDFQMGLLLITHDLGVVSQWADRVAVMYDGRRLELGDTRDLFRNPQHPYTRGLMQASLHCTEPTHYSERSLAEIEVISTAGAGDPTFNVIAERPSAVNAAAPRGGGHVTAASSREAHPLLQAFKLSVRYPGSRSSRANAVDGVSFSVEPGQTIGLVGESGCGKSTLARALLRLIPLQAGQLMFDGNDITHATERELRGFRKRVQMVFQDPFGSLNPRHTIGSILESALIARGDLDRVAIRARAAYLIERVGLPADTARRYPNEFSGGQRQRIGIARALMVEPELLVLDEPVSALDVSVQAQILNLLVELKIDLGLAYLFISHDLTVIRYMADEIIVMRDGRFSELGRFPEFWSTPQTDYARALMAATPRNAYSDPVMPPST